MFILLDGIFFIYLQKTFEQNNYDTKAVQVGPIAPQSSLHLYMCCIVQCYASASRAAARPWSDASVLSIDSRARYCCYDISRTLLVLPHSESVRKERHTQNFDQKKGLLETTMREQLGRTVSISQRIPSVDRNLVTRYWGLFIFLLDHECMVV